MNNLEKCNATLDIIKEYSSIECGCLRKVESLEIWLKKRVEKK